MTEYQTQQRGIAKVRWTSYKTAKQLYGVNSKRTAYERIRALMQIQYVKQITGKQVTDRDYTPDMSKGVAHIVIISKRYA